MKTIWLVGLIVALMVGPAAADPFIGNTMRYSIDLKDGVDITALGDSDVDLGTGDITTTGAASAATITTTGATTGAGATYTGMVQAEHIYSTDDINCTDDLVVGDDGDVVGDFTAGTIASDAGVSGTTGTFTEPVTISKAIGTAPFVITSTTKSTNMNADLLDDHDSAYFAIASELGTVADLNNGEADLVTAINATDIRLDTLETDTVANVTRIGALESNDTTHDTNIAANLGYIGNTSNLTTTATTAVTAINELDTDLAVVEAYPYWHIQTITTPIVATVDRIYPNLNVNLTATNVTMNVSVTATQPDVARTLTATPNATTTSWIRAVGTDIDGTVISEYFNFTASYAAVTGNKAFLTVTNLYWNNTGGNYTEVDIGVSDELGLDLLITDTAQVMSASLDGTREATHPTTVKGSTKSECTADIDGTLDGAKDVILYMVV